MRSKHIFQAVLEQAMLAKSGGSESRVLEVEIMIESVRWNSARDNGKPLSSMHHILSAKSQNQQHVVTISSRVATGQGKFREKFFFKVSEKSGHS